MQCRCQVSHHVARIFLCVFSSSNDGLKKISSLENKIGIMIIKEHGQFKLHYIFIPLRSLKLTTQTTKINIPLSFCHTFLLMLVLKIWWFTVDNMCTPKRCCNLSRYLPANFFWIKGIFFFWECKLRPNHNQRHPETFEDTEDFWSLSLVKFHQR